MSETSKWLRRASTAVVTLGGAAMIIHGEHRGVQQPGDQRPAQTATEQTVDAGISPTTEVDTGIIAGGIGGLVILGGLAEVARRRREEALYVGSSDFEHPLV